MAVTRSSSAAASRNTSSASQNTGNKNKTIPKTPAKKKTKRSSTKKPSTIRSSTRTESGQAQQNQLDPSPSSSACKRTKSPGVRLLHGRIYDSENGKTCHQCRQKTMDFAVACKNQNEDRQCTCHFCHTCLLNRYGEKAEQKVALGDWKCPKCRGICNCSQCMKKRGCYPTGRLVTVAKATGFSSVSEMLQLNNSEKAKQDMGALSKRKIAPKEERVDITRKHGKENSHVGKSCSKSRHKSNVDEKKMVEKEIMQDKGGSPKNLTSSKELGGVSTRGRKRRNSSDGKSESKFQVTTLNLDGNEKGNQNGNFKKIRNCGISDDSIEGSKDDAALIEKRSPKNCWIPKAALPKEEKTRGRDDGGQLEKLCSNKQGPKRYPVRNSMIEANEANMTKITTNDESEGKQVNRFYKHQKKTAEIQRKVSEVEIPLPQGFELTSVANIDLPAEDVGHALQFLEFCEAFGEVLNLKKGQPEGLLRDLACGRSSRWREGSSAVRFHIKLLSVILNDSGKKCSCLGSEGKTWWLEALTRCISESQYQSKELQLDCLNVVADRYEDLSLSNKLRLLNFLCDEALGTEELRSCIYKQNSEFVQEEKNLWVKSVADREKEKNMKIKLQNEVAREFLKKNGALLTASAHLDLVSKIKAEVAQTLAESVKAKDTAMEMKKKQRSDAVRSEPILLDGDGRIFWKLRGHSGKREILLQDIGLGDSIAFEDRWFSYNAEEGAIIGKYISRQLGK